MRCGGGGERGAHDDVLGHQLHLGLQVEFAAFAPGSDGEGGGVAHGPDVAGDPLAVEGGLHQPAAREMPGAFGDGKGVLAEELQLLEEQPLGEVTGLGGEHLVDQLGRVHHGHGLRTEHDPHDGAVGAQLLEEAQPVAKERQRVSDERAPARSDRREPVVVRHEATPSVCRPGPCRVSSSRAARISAWIIAVGA